MLDQLKSVLQEHKLKATNQRLTLLEYMMSHDTHPTAEMIHNDLPDISLATVYNTLEKFVNAKLVVVIEGISDGKRHYDAAAHPHYHVINTNTNEIIDAANFDPAPLIKAAQAATGLKITEYRIDLYGVKPED
ncbi:ferric uptake regulator [Fructobacillus pseudoficulneus]|uniref:Ferric uptake regulator n=1 Tax=Fructobacillus pseudoficulneus TaxID=220714 RepID=A0A3F3H7Q2_9LACO|nr:Fur family transcriptional regulator [Fructobacillus pseudoficulneus]GAP02463.1 ferric uptake regulator [Fructobacillus pseudoficulneus]SEH37061.1 Fur family transcriptional regulator, peroxide stress response regulator [Fructobacillus pseudoficulneus]